jgi:hypothetical protein
VTIVIAGGSGFLGRKLAGRLEKEGHDVITLSRSPSGARNQISWVPDGNAGALPQHLDGVDAVVNLAGENVADKRWTAARKAALRDSRILSTRTLVRALAACAHAPRAFISASAVGYYGAHGDEAVTESTPAGSDFLARLCVDWEAEAGTLRSEATRLAIVRTGLPLDGGGGALGKMLLPFKLGLGATLGPGDQYMPWIVPRACSTPPRPRPSPTASSPTRLAASSIDPPSSAHRHSRCICSWEKWRRCCSTASACCPPPQSSADFASNIGISSRRLQAWDSDRGLRALRA